MINLNLENNPILYKDYEEGLKFLATLKDEDYEYPKDITLFHIYTEIKNDKELECIKSFLATQHLEKTKLIVWSDYDINDNPLIQPYKKYLDLRIWDAKKEAEDTPLAGKSHLDAVDGKYWLQSDLLRILVLYKYGGVWVDSDIILLRDWKPILDQEYMYQWGSETNYKEEGACATVLSGFKESEFMTHLINGVVESEILPNTTVWGKDMFAKTWNKWPHFTIFPSTFFNTEWLVSKKYPGLNLKIIDGWFAVNEYVEDNLFLDAFGWHWHNSTNKDKPIESGSKFYRLREITDGKLVSLGLM
tara:strand:- start:19086 stop:19994 length:909 start_codon:yes stop_codon:yes gene_type:complete